ncbi:MAG: hypothetical protein Q4C63_06685 [Eubacteriales bacterium]|nr:hypothetical protein [Eubacteriales bacterium]
MNMYPNIPLAVNWGAVLNVIAVILIVLLVLLVILYFLGRKLEAKQLDSQKLIEASSQTVSMLIIDKKKMKLSETNLPKIVTEQTPKYLRWTKMPVVKAKVGPKVLTLIADGRVFRQLPVKTEVKVKVSGIYITEIVKGAVLTEKDLKKRQKEKEKAAKKAAKAAGK